MTKRLPLATVFVVLGAFLLVPGTATANDRGVWDAYAYSFPVSFHKAFRAYRRAERRVVRTKLQSARAMKRAMRASTRLSSVLRATAGEVRKARPSSDDGRRAKALGMASLRLTRRGLSIERAGYRAWLHGHRSRAVRRFRASERALRASDRRDEQAVKAFRAAGVDTRRPKVAAR